MRDLKIESNGGIDEGLYSRQLYVLGHDAMRRMQSSDILISGVGGLGIEIAKNIILGGVKSVTLHDTLACCVKDFSSQFYLNKCAIGKNRAEACLRQLTELNNYVTTSAYVGELTESFLRNFKVVVLTETSDAEQLRISDICRAHNVALIVADTKGLFAQIFCDFGENFIVYDDDGLPPKCGQIISITQEKEAVVSTEKWHNLFDGEYVTFSDVSLFCFYLFFDRSQFTTSYIYFYKNVKMFYRVTSFSI
jgi:ubiquitin-activating enzyme E1